MTELSPQAQAVLFAWSGVVGWGGDPPPIEQRALAAALRAAADQVVPGSPAMIPSLMMVRYRLLAIADELEGSND